MTTRLNPDGEQLCEIGLLPDFCDVRVIFMLVLIVELLALVLALAAPSSVTGFWNYLAYLSMLMQWTALLDAALLCRLRRWLNARSVLVGASTSFVLLMAVSLVTGLASVRLNAWLQIDPHSSPLGEHLLFRILLISAAVYAVMLRYFYIQQQWKTNLNASAQAELQALKARIRPHFLFNSMNTIASLIRIRPEDAEKAVEDLSDLFRASLMESNRHSLADELAITRSYLDIEALRMGDRLQVEWDVDESLNDEEIPALSLQPLAENAIYHGIEPTPGGGTVSIRVRRNNDRMELAVSNPSGGTTGSSHAQGNRMAQDNIRQRLRIAYGDNACFRINATKTIYTVLLEIPLVT